MQTAKLHASRKCNSIKIIIMEPLVDYFQFFNSAILAKYNIVSLRLRRPTVALLIHRVYTAQKMLVLVICCTNEISCAHRLQKIRWNIAPTYLKSFCILVSALSARASLRSSSRGLLDIPRMRTATVQSRSFAYVGPSALNRLPESLRMELLSLSPLQLRKRLKTFLFASLASTDTIEN